MNKYRIEKIRREEVKRRESLTKGKIAPLYAYRKVLNGEEIIAWAKEAGFPETMPEDELHITVAFSKTAFDWGLTTRHTEEIEIPSSDQRSVKPLGDEGAVVLKLGNVPFLQDRWKSYIDSGASYDFPEYQPHITLTYLGEGIDLSTISPFTGVIKLGPEILEEINGDWQDNVTEKSINVDVAKFDAGLGIVFGYAIVCEKDGEPYFDTQNDFIPEESMLKATSEFMAGSRIAKDMHVGNSVGQVVFGFPITKDIAKALEIEVSKTGFIVGMKPNDEAMLEKFASGEYTGFSIGGSRQIDRAA